MIKIQGQMKISKPILITLMFAIPFMSVAQNEGFIYGKVTTEDGDSYTGPIRWGKEEVYWTDMFNAAKEENENIDFLSRDEMDYLEDRMADKYHGRWNIVNVNWSYRSDFKHQFGCQFGEIKSLEVIRGDEVLVTMQNGVEIEVDGSGYNDIGSDVKILDDELGEMSIDWDRIEKVEFMDTPRNLDSKFGDPLYGTVYREQGEFTGYVQWDHDERVTTDKLDGDSDDGDVSIPFGKLKSIERDGYSSSIIVLKSGRELELDDSNDVDSGNRGIIVTIEGMGRVDIPWKEFDKVVFSEAPKSSVKYSDFSSQTELTGTVTVTNGDSHSGKIVYDLDEAYDFEVLDGEVDKTEFVVPFRNIKSIEPRNDDSSNVTLKNGEKMVLWDSQDVNEFNTGILVFKGSNPIYIPWEKVQKISFN